MNDKLFIRKNEGLFTCIDSRLVILVEASDGWSKIITQQGVHLVRSTLSQLEEQLPEALFCRVHRTYIAAFEHIRSFTADSIRVLDRDIPLSRTYAEKFFSKLNIIM
jgi:DNA-binding LytR/AlgR family response regulator